MTVEFYKYHGTGNDFILVDNRSKVLQGDQTLLFRNWCDRRFGIGADGVILLQKDPETDFEMVYYNSDGNQSSMCGNGGRCITAFAKQLGVIDREATFRAIDGMHNGFITDNGEVRLKMQPVKTVEKKDQDYVIDTGSPHYVKFVSNTLDLNVNKEGNRIRNSELYKEKGINVNFVEEKPDHLLVRTYERGVEEETFSCGTGVVASALAASVKNASDQNKWNVKTPGGDLQVEFIKKDSSFDDIYLTGPAVLVFKGETAV